MRLFFPCWTKLFATLFISLVAMQATAGEPFADIDKFIELLAPHAGRYPPQFDSAQQKAAMVKGLKDVLATMEVGPKQVRGGRESLLRYAFLNSMGHNLDLEGCSERTIGAYEELLRLDPNDKRANFYYGSFLVGTKLISTSVPYLQKAIELGATEANYSLGFAYLSHKRNNDALTAFRKYLEYDPENATAKMMIARIENGDAALNFNVSD